MRSLKLSLYIAIFSLTQLYLPSVVEYNTTCFGPLCGPSSDVTYRLSYTMCIGGGAAERSQPTPPSPHPPQLSSLTPPYNTPYPQT